MSRDSGKRANARAGFMLLGEHSKGCWGAEAGGFVCYDGSERRDAVGRKAVNGREWHRFRCNDPDCTAVALVRWDTLTEFVNAHVDTRPVRALTLKGSSPGGV